MAGFSNSNGCKKMLALALCVAFLTLTTADCPDADIQCKIGGSNVGVITIGQCYDLLQGK